MENKFGKRHDSTVHRLEFGAIKRGDFVLDKIMIVGLLAGLCTTLSFIPQIAKIYRTRRTRDLSLSTYVLLSVGIFLWVVYGVALRQIAIVLPNMVVLVMSLYIVALKLTNK